MPLKMKIIKHYKWVSMIKLSNEVAVADWAWKNVKVVIVASCVEVV